MFRLYNNLSKKFNSTTLVRWSNSTWHDSVFSKVIAHALIWFIGSVVFSALKSWAQNVNFNNGGAELEVGVSVKLKNFYLMTGASYLMGSAPSKGFIAVDLNVGFAF